MVGYEMGPPISCAQSSCKFPGNILEIPESEIDTVRPDDVWHIFISLAQPFPINPGIVFRNDLFPFYERSARSATRQDHHNQILLISQPDQVVHILEIGFIRG